MSIVIIGFTSTNPGNLNKIDFILTGQSNLGWAIPVIDMIYQVFPSNTKLFIKPPAQEYWQEEEE